MIPVAELDSRKQEILAPLTSPPPGERHQSGTLSQCISKTQVQRKSRNYIAIHSLWGLLQVLPASTQVALQDHSYSSLTVAASTSLTSTPSAIAVADIPTSSASISARRDDPIDPSTVKEALSISSEEIEQIMQATTTQTKCGLWHEQLAKQITSSKAGRIVTQKKKTVPLPINILYLLNIIQVHFSPAKPAILHNLLI